MIIGDTGVGKEVVARTLHDLSGRANNPFIAINCAALPENLIESELFGHEPGAFPGAIRPRYGKFEHGRGGTILLDEIGSMPIDLQAKFLRVLQERVITAARLQRGWCRWMYASSLPTRSISSRRWPPAASGLTFSIASMSRRCACRRLTQRRADIPLLVPAARHGNPRLVTAAMKSRYRRTCWPRWRNATGRATCANCVTPPKGWFLGSIRLSNEINSSEPNSGRLADKVAAFEKGLIANAIATYGGALKPVYESLGISRKTLYEKMQKFGLDKKLVATDMSGESDGR